MPQTQHIAFDPAPTGAALIYLPPEQRGKKIKASGVSLVHEYITDAQVLAESDWVYLQIVLVAYQIHPATVAELAALGPVGGDNAKRWTVEGPLMHRPGDPGAGANCSMKLEVAHSMTADPGSVWRKYEPGRYRLRSVKARLTITRPSTTYDFRVCRFDLLATRIATPQRARRVHAGVVDAIPAGMSRIVSRDFEVAGSLEIEADAYLEILT